MSAEIEIKYRVADRTLLQALDFAPLFEPDLTLTAVQHMTLRDTYLDTADFLLLRSGCVFRVRQRDGGSVVTLKGLRRVMLGAAVARTELEGAVRLGCELEPGEWPAAIRDPVVQLIGEVIALAPIAFVAHERKISRVLVSAETRDIGELIAERVQVGTASLLGEMETPADTFDEVEFELASDAGAADLARVSTLFDDDSRFKTTSESKLEFGLRANAAHADGRPVGVLGLRPDMTMAEAGRLYWRKQFVEILLNEAESCAGDVEAVHDMRVAIRRSRSAVRVFGGHFKRKALRPFLKRLRRTARRLGAVRDLDVGLIKLAEYRATAAAGDHGGLDRLEARWRIERDAARAALVEWLSGEEWREFLVNYDRFLWQPGAGVKTPSPAPPSEEVRHVIPMAILERFAVVRDYDRLLGHDGVSEADLHALRIDCKQLRYALELVEHLTGKPGKRSIRHMKRLQDHLGSLNDAAVSRELVERTIEAGLDRLDIAGYLKHLDERIERVRLNFDPIWSEFNDDQTRHRLMRAIGNL